MFLRLWTRAPRTRMVSCSERTSVVSLVICLVAKGKPRQRVSSAQPKLEIIRPLSKLGKRPNLRGRRRDRSTGCGNVPLKKARGGGHEGIREDFLDRAGQRWNRRASGCGGLWRLGPEYAWTHRGSRAAGNPESGTARIGQHRAAETSVAGHCSAWSIWQGGDALPRERYDDGTLGNGGRVAGPAVSGLQERIPEGLDRRG